MKKFFHASDEEDDDENLDFVLIDYAGLSQRGFGGSG
jgi:hypothetical protein